MRLDVECFRRGAEDPHVCIYGKSRDTRDGIGNDPCISHGTTKGAGKDKPMARMIAGDPHAKQKVLDMCGSWRKSKLRHTWATLPTCGGGLRMSTRAKLTQRQNPTRIDRTMVNMTSVETFKSKWHQVLPMHVVLKLTLIKSVLEGPRQCTRSLQSLKVVFYQHVEFLHWQDYDQKMRLEKLRSESKELAETMVAKFDGGRDRFAQSRAQGDTNTYRRLLSEVAEGAWMQHLDNDKMWDTSIKQKGCSPRNSHGSGTDQESHREWRPALYGRRLTGKKSSATRKAV